MTHLAEHKHNKRFISINLEIDRHVRIREYFKQFGVNLPRDYQHVPQADPEVVYLVAQRANIERRPVLRQVSTGMV